MAAQAESPASIPTAQVVGNAFVEQYYHILHHTPELVYRFYQDSSVLSRPDPSGAMASVTTMQGINERILSLNYKDYIAEIKTADAQQSLGDGVVVLVTGYLTGTDNLKKKFAQSFFLAPQEKGFFILNDVFRYVEDKESAKTVSVSANGNNKNVQVTTLTQEPEPPSHVQDPSEQVNVPVNEEEVAIEPEVCDASDNEDGSVTGGEVVDPPIQSDQTENVTVTTSLQTALQDDGPKTYASILKAMRAYPSPNPTKAPASHVKAKTPSSNQVAVVSAPPAEPSILNSETRPEKNDVLEEEGHSIYVRNLPQSASPTQVEEVFTKFGQIKPGGVQVRSNKQGFCFGFVEFESADSMKSAIEASPIVIGNRKAVIEEKRTTTRVSAAANMGNGRGRYPSSSSRGGFLKDRNESFRGRGNFGGGRGYGRSEFRGHSEFSGRPRSRAGRGAEGYQQVDQNGTGNGARQGA